MAPALTQRSYSIPTRYTNMISVAIPPPFTSKRDTFPRMQIANGDNPLFDPRINEAGRSIIEVFAVNDSV